MPQLSLILVGIAALLAGALAGVDAPLGFIAPVAVVVVLIGSAVSRTKPAVLLADLPARDSWGGRAVVALALGVVGAAFVTRVVDGAVQRYDSTGRRYLEAAGTSGRSLGALLLLAALVFAVIAVHCGSRRLEVPSWYSRWLVAVLAWWVICAYVLRWPGFSISMLYEAASIVALVVAVVVSPPTRKTLLSLTHVLNFTVVSALAYGLANPDQQLPCRPDKCGMFDSLFVGYFFQENSAARLVVLLVPVAWVVPSRLYLTATLALSGVFILATGSRTSLLSFVVAAAFVLWMRARLRDSESGLPLPRLVRAVPFVLTAASLYLFVTASAGDLTDRGAIYAGIRRQLTGWALLAGSGSDTVAGIRINGGFRPFGEHGQAPHLLVYTGVLGLLLFIAAMAALLLGTHWSAEQVAAFGVVLTASTQYVTEPVWELQLRAMPLALLLLTIGLFVAGNRTSAEDRAAGLPVVEDALTLPNASSATATRRG